MLILFTKPINYFQLQVKLYFFKPNEAFLSLWY